MAHGLRLETTFISLKNRDYRWLWFGRLASSATFEMGSVAQGWLVYQLTGSAMMLSLVGAGWSFSTLFFSLYGGVLCDRLEKRDIIFWTRVGMGLNTLVIGLLVGTGVVQVWHLAASSLLTGVCFAFLMPAQQAILSDLVDRPTLLNAVSLDAIGMGLMGIFGASLAGVLIERVGVQAVFYLNAGLYGMALLTLTGVRRTGRNSVSRGSVWVDLRDGVTYLWKTPALTSLLVLALARALFGMSYRTFMPKYASENLGMGATGLGILMAAPGLGGLMSALTMASLGDFRGKGRLLLRGGLVLGVALIAFVSLRWLPLVMLFLTIVGATNNLCMVTNNALLQTNAVTQYRGRVMSIYMMTWGLTPFGSLPAGALADQFGVPTVVIGQGILVLVMFAGLWAARPEVNKLE